MAANCRIFLERCREAGLNPLITGTVRDDAYQLDAYNRGASKSKRPSFHAQGVGLAFDFCKNVAGHEYDDPVFFQSCGKIGEEMGFEWGGRWKSFPDYPHMQWSGPGHTYQSSDIWAGRLPPLMPLYGKEEVEMTQEQFNQMFEAALVNHAAKLKTRPAGEWAAASWDAVQKAGIMDGSAPQAPLTREQAAVIFQRLKLLE